MARTATEKAHEPEDETQAKAILVLGMHRSGTSAFTRVLSLCGAALPRTLMMPEDGLPGDGNSVAGFWESHVLRDVDDRALTAAGSAWDDIRPFNRQWFSTEEAKRFAENLSRACSAEYGDARLIVVKDPRICRLLPLWLQALDDIGRQTAVLIPTRNPLEVAASLSRRDGFTTAKGLLLWLRHLLAVERESRHLKRCFVGYTELLEDWRATTDRVTAQLDLDLPRRDVRSEIEIESFLDPALRHHEIPTEHLGKQDGVSAWITDAYSWVLEAAESPHLDPEPLQKIEAELISADLLLASEMRVSISHGSRKDEPSTKATQRGSVSKLGTRETLSTKHRSGTRSAAGRSLARFESHLARIAETSSDEGGPVDRLAAEIRATRFFIEAESERSRGRVEELETELRRLREAHEAAYAAAQELMSAHSDGLARLQSRDHEVVRLWETARLLERGVGELRADHALRDARLIRYGEQAAHLDAEVSTLQDRLAREVEAAQIRAVATAEHLETGLAGFHGDIEGLRHELTVLRASVTGLRSEIGELGSRLTLADETARSEIDTLRTGLDNLREQLRQSRAQQERIHRSRGLLQLSGGALHDHRRHSGPGAVGSRRYTLVSLAFRLPVWAAQLKLRPKLQLWLDARLVWRSGLFVEDYYLARYPDVATTHMDPLGHYIKHGAAERRDPNPFFDTGYYLDNNPDVATTGLHPLVHFIACGAAEGRDPGPGFNTRFYVAQNPEISAHGLNPLLHFLKLGIWNDRQPVPLSDSEEHPVSTELVPNAGQQTTSLDAVRPRT